MLFAIGFPYKQCNFWPLCLPIKMASKTVIRPIALENRLWIASYLRIVVLKQIGLNLSKTKNLVSQPDKSRDYAQIMRLRTKVT